jgi:tartrate dehydrogenase/decarboxylase/D-malate dehydrogenase
MASSYDIAVIGGDGIGPEVLKEGIKVLKVVEARFGLKFTFQEYPWGTDYYFRTGTMMPEDGLDSIASADAVFFGAVGHPDVQDHVTLNGLLLPMRRGFDQYVCQRPSVLYPGVTSPLRGMEPGDIDMVVIRENTEGEYANVGGFQYAGFPDEVAIQTSVFTRRGIERVVRYSFELARSRDKKKKLASITKSNAQGYGMVLWDQVFDEIAKDYPDIETESLLVDAACMNFIRRPDSFDVVVGSNLFGDILTDIGAIITGSMGLAASANINPEKKFPSVFEPVHGSAPDIAGKGIANPLAAILSASMLLQHLGETAAAKALHEACMSVLRDGEIVPPDLGGSAGTIQMGTAVISALEAQG